jgi:hypothetical protein
MGAKRVKNNYGFRRWTQNAVCRPFSFGQHNRTSPKRIRPGFPPVKFPPAPGGAFWEGARPRAGGAFWEGARPRAPKHPPTTLVYSRLAGTPALPYACPRAAEVFGRARVPARRSKRPKRWYTRGWRGRQPSHMHVHARRRVFWEGARPRAPKHPPTTLVYSRLAGTPALPYARPRASEGVLGGRASPRAEASTHDVGLLAAGGDASPPICMSPRRGVFWEGARPRAPKHPPTTLVYSRLAGTPALIVARAGYPQVGLRAGLEEPSSLAHLWITRPREYYAQPLWLRVCWARWRQRLPALSLEDRGRYLAAAGTPGKSRLNDVPRAPFYKGRPGGVHARRTREPQRRKER